MCSGVTRILNWGIVALEPTERFYLMYTSKGCIWWVFLLHTKFFLDRRLGVALVTLATPLTMPLSMCAE